MLVKDKEQPKSIKPDPKKVVLAFSGGLDTTFCAVYLAKNQGMEVHAALVDTGGFSREELDKIQAHARQLGVASFELLQVTQEYYDRCLKFLIYGNVLKNNTYPLSVSAERVFQAMAIAQYAKKIGAGSFAHGSTGAGNDQVRFDMIFQTLAPELEIITPIRDLQLSREAEIDFLKENGVELNLNGKNGFEKAAYSINKGLWGTSVGGKETLKSMGALPEEAFPTPLEEKDPVTLTITFKEGEPIALNDVQLGPVKLIRTLEKLLAPYGIGRDIHVGDTIIGIKGRVGFEAAAPVTIIKAHHALEKHVLTKWQLYWKDQLSAWYGNWLHEGQFLDPVMRDIEAMMASTQKYVTGTVQIKAYMHHFRIEGIHSKHDLMSAKFGSYGEMNLGWTGEDVKGFSKIFGNQTKMYHLINGGGNGQDV